MPKRSRKVQKKTLAVTVTSARDENQSAFDAIQALIDKTEVTDGKDPLAVLLGRRGGLKGGHARAAGMTAKERSDSAKNAAKARWRHKRD